jgi:hypothetical protein
MLVYGLRFKSRHKQYGMTDFRPVLHWSSWIVNTIENYGNSNNFLPFSAFEHGKTPYLPCFKDLTIGIPAWICRN